VRLVFIANSDALPTKTRKPCAVCGVLISEGSRCEVHRLPRLLPVKDNRPTANARGYDYEWRKKRNAYIMAHPWCVDPYGLHAGTPIRALIVDHIKPRRQGGADDESNYQGLCQACHNIKTARDGSRSA
jgi:5-methylcytosine-specific restriction protein A